jgi:hypothetical protein
MSGRFSKVEMINRRRPPAAFSTDLELALIAETMQPGISISYVAGVTRSRRACCSAGGG